MKPSPEAIAAVSDDDVRAAWDQFFARADGLEHIAVLQPEEVREPHITLTALRRVIAADRLRAAQGGGK